MRPSFRSLAVSLFAALNVAMLVVLTVAGVSLAHASVGDAPPPSRVGRIGAVEGEVSMLSEVNEGWRRAKVNFPITSRNSVWVNGTGRAEVRIGASALRVSDESILDFIQVDDAKTRAFLQRGTLNVRLRSYGAATNDADRDEYRDGFQLESTEGTFTLEANGRYRLDAGQDRYESRISVFAGRVRVSHGGNTLIVESGKALVIRNTGGNASLSFEAAIESAFDRWAEARDIAWDQTHTRVVRSREVSPYMTGYEDLDRHGEWIDDREYGRLWFPRVVAAGWAPYRFGSWAYVRPWGWTWIDDAPWGFAPFHYGRWIVRAGRWHWWPGVYTRRPVYAPALVAWVGSGGASVRLSVGPTVGWFPLGPREIYVPPYYRGNTYIRNVNNITNNITVINPPTTFTNQTVGTTVVNQNIVVRGEPVWQNGAQRGNAPAGALVAGGGSPGLQPSVRGEAVMQPPLPTPNATPIPFSPPFAGSASGNQASVPTPTFGPQRGGGAIQPKPLSLEPRSPTPPQTGALAAAPAIRGQPVQTPPPLATNTAPFIGGAPSASGTQAGTVGAMPRLGGEPVRQPTETRPLTTDAPRLGGEALHQEQNVPHRREKPLAHERLDRAPRDVRPTDANQEPRREVQRKPSERHEGRGERGERAERNDKIERAEPRSESRPKPMHGPENVKPN